MHEITLIADKILTLQKQKKDGTVIVAVDGRCGTGKTMLAGRLKELLDCNVFPLDEFYLEEQQRAQLPPGFANADTMRFADEVLKKLRLNLPFCYSRYDCRTGRCQKVAVNVPKKINIVEGSFCLDKSLIAHYDLKIFLKADFEVRKQRLIERGADIEMFLNKWIPIENAFFEINNIEQYSDMVIET